MALPTSGELSIEDLKKELRIDLPNGGGPTDFDISESLQLLLARTKPGASNKNFPLTLPDDFWGARRPNDPIDFSGQIAGGAFTRNFTATRATQGATTLRFKVYLSGNVLRGEIVDKGASILTFGIVPDNRTTVGGITDTHGLEVKIDLLSGSPSVYPSYGVFKVADATAQEIEVNYPGPYVGSKMVSFRMTVRQQDLPTHTFQAVISLLAENTFVPETPYDAAANINKAMWANITSESDTYTHAIYSFVRRNGAQGDGYYLWRNANGQNGFDEYHFLGPWKDYDTLQFNIGVNAFNQSGGLGTGTPVGSWAWRNGAVNWQWQDITTTEKGVHSIGNRRLNSLNITVQVRSKNTGRVFQVATINVASEVTIASWSMPVVNFPKYISSKTTENRNVRAGMKMYRDGQSGHILLVPVIAIGSIATYSSWTGGSGYLNGNVPITSRPIPQSRIQINWDTGGSGASGGTGSLLLTTQDYSSAPTWYGIERGVNGWNNESVLISFTDTWTGASIWGWHQFIFNQNRNYTPPPPATPFNAQAANGLSSLKFSRGAHGTDSADARVCHSIIQFEGKLAIQQFSTFGSGSEGNTVIGGAYFESGSVFLREVSSSNNFSVRMQVQSRNSSRGYVQAKGAAYGDDTGWVNVSGTTGKQAIVWSQVGASAGHREGQISEIAVLVQIRDNSTGTIVFSKQITATASARGGTSNDR